MKSNKPLLLILLLYVGIKFLFSGFIPFWDGGQYYYGCLGPAILAPFNLANFNCFGHPSFMYMFLIGIFQYIQPGNIFLLHLPITLLGAASVVAFFKVIRYLFPSEKIKNECYLITALYAFHPVLLSNSINLNLDYAVLVFYIFLLAFLLYKKFAWAFWCGLFLVFSKEPAVLMYGSTLIVYWFLEYRKKRINNHFWLLIIPLVLFGIYVGYTRLFLHISPLWANFGMKRAVEILLIPDLRNPFFIRYLEGIFLFNFNWLFTGVIIIALGKYLLQKNKKIKTVSLFLFVTFFINFYILTSLKTWLVLRYFLPLYPYLIIFFFASLLSLIQVTRIRQILLSIGLATIITSNLFSLDPVTRFQFDHFQFGKYEMYKVGDVDGLVYNLQFTAFHYLLNSVYSDLKPQADDIFVFFDEVGDWQFTGRVDKKTSKKVLGATSSFKIHSFSIEKLIALPQKPSRVYYINLPSMRTDIRKTPLNHYYQIHLKKHYWYLGYQFDVYKLILKNVPKNRNQ